jgi:hypothetical protein
VPLADFSFYNVVLAVHIGAVVFAFGVTFANPIMFAVVGDDAQALPAVHRAERAIHRAQAAGLVVIVLAGLYLAHKLDAYKYFYVQWGIGVSLVIGALGGAYMAPREKRIEEELGGDRSGGLSTEYRTLARQLRNAGAAQGVLVLLTILFMATQLGAP